MLAVLYGHGVGLVHGLPFSEEIKEQPGISFCRILFYTTFSCGVNIFILISGWFGIHATRQGLVKFIFQFIFLLWGLYIIFILTGKTQLSLEGIKISIGLTDGYWFIMGYLGLYILSPILNAFVENATKKQFKSLLLSFYTFQCFYSWLTNYVNYFSGYSIMLFCGLYLTARYVRRYPIIGLNNNAGKTIICIILLISIIVLMSLKHFGHASHMLRYDSPLIILQSLCILLFFNKLSFQNTIINWLAASCFAVYIIHFNPFVFPYFINVAKIIDNSFMHFSYVFAITLYLISVFILCVLLDQLRIFVWKLLKNI